MRKRNCGARDLYPVNALNLRTSFAAWLLSHLREIQTHMIQTQRNINGNT